MKKVILILVSVCLLLTGCGGDKKDSAPEHTPSSAASNSGFSTSHKFNFESGASAEPGSSEPPSEAATHDPSGGNAWLNSVKSTTGPSSAQTENKGGESQAGNASEGEIEVNNVYEAEDDDTPSSECTFMIDCSKALDYENLSSELRGVLPEGGILYIGSAEIEDGDTVFDILSRVTKESGIPMEFSSSPVYGSNYIEGINSLYEFDCGPNSGWVYFVNGERLSVGCDKYSVKDGDDVRWYYTLDMGNDIEL